MKTENNGKSNHELPHQQEATKSALPVPSKEEVQKWVKEDLQRAHYFLGMLQRYPEIVEDLGSQMYDHAMRKEGVPAVNHVLQDKI